MSKIFKVTLLMVLISSLFSAKQMDVVYAGNIMINGGFESGLWAERSGNFSIDTSIFRSGSASLKVSGSGSHQYIGSNRVPVLPNQGYRVSVWVRSDLAESRPAISMDLLSVNASNQALGWYPSGQTHWVSLGGGRQNWTQYTGTFYDLPAATDTVRVYLRVDSGVTGNVWFDDVTIESINLAPTEGFETGLWPNNSGFTRNSSEFHSGQYSASATGKSTTSTLYTQLIPIHPKERYKLTLWIKTDSVSASNAVSVGVLQVNDANQAISWYGGSAKLIATGGTQGWTKYEADLSGFHQATRNLRLYLRMDANVTGTVWFDSVRLNQQYRDNFMWGINGHGKFAAAYPASRLSEQYDKAEELGVQIYRVNVNPDSANGNYDWTYMDDVVNTAYERGMKIYMVLYSSLGGSEAALMQWGEAISSRYKGKIDYYQLGNEVDLVSKRGSQYDGSLPSHFDPVLYAESRGKIAALGTGIRNGDPDANRAINISYKHTAFLEMLQADGVEWEVNGLDWYDNMGNIAPTLAKLQTYPQQEILIAETNTFYGTQTKTEQQQADYIESISHQIYYEAPSKVSGVLVYELLDEPALSGGEAHYGLLYSSSGGVIGAEKLAFGVYRDLIQRRQ